jgi:hypothetical protein
VGRGSAFPKAGITGKEVTELSLHGLRGKDVGHGRAVALAIAVLAAIGLLTAVPASTQATAGDPALVGQWSSPQSWPIVAVHMSLLPTGQVIALDGFAAGPNSEHLWDPVSGAFTPVPYGRNLFCAGHIQLADGRTLFVGGHVSANSGLADTTIYNPTNKTWFRGPDMTVGRWYPTATQLPDGRVFTLSGDNIVQDRPGTDPPFSDASVDSLPEVYDPKTNTWTDLPQGRLTTPLYPFLFVLSDGRILDAGPDKTTRVMTPGAWTWSTIGSSSFDAHSAVMYRPDKIMKSGSWADPDFKGSLTYQSGAKTAVLDMAAASPAWRDTAPMAQTRRRGRRSRGCRTAGSTTRPRCCSRTAVSSWRAVASFRTRAPSTRRTQRSTRPHTCSRGRGRCSRRSRRR